MRRSPSFVSRARVPFVRGATRSLLFACALVLPGMLSGAPAARAENGAKEFRYSDTGYVMLDPAHGITRNDQRLILSIFEGLTTLDPQTGRAVPGVAERWEVSPDRLTWTFHLRADARWSDEKPVRAQDFVYAWRRIVDSLTESAWLPTFRTLRGVGTIIDAGAAKGAMAAARKRLEQEIAANPDGIPGLHLRELIVETGLWPFASRMDDPTMRRFLAWGEDPFPKEKVEEIKAALQKESKRFRDAYNPAMDDFGVTQGVLAKDDRTLVVQTTGWAPFLPELLSGSAFVPLRQDLVESRGDLAFGPIAILTNGPYHLAGRGPKPPAPNAKTPSTVHLVASKTYKGPRAPRTPVIYAETDQDNEGKAVLARFKSGAFQWVLDPDPQATKEVRQEAEKTPGFRTRPSGAVTYLVFRCDRKPFDNVAARRAFALAIDKANATKDTWPQAIPAERIVPSHVRGVVAGAVAPAANPKAAKEALKAAFAKDAPELDILYGEESMSIVDALVEQWGKVLGASVSARIFTPAGERGDLGDTVKAVSGVYPMSLVRWTGDYDDPAAFLDHFRSNNLQGRTGWHDAAFEALMAASWDPASATDAVLAHAKDSAALSSKLTAAKGGSADALAALRLQLLLEAERRLLDEFVVVPVAFPRLADLIAASVKGLGSDQAWNNAIFVGSLATVER
jgi:oligopeptide transport system substrate-binding protein